MNKEQLTDEVLSELEAKAYIITKIKERMLSFANPVTTCQLSTGSFSLSMHLHDVLCYVDGDDAAETVEIFRLLVVARCERKINLFKEDIVNLTKSAS